MKNSFEKNVLKEKKWKIVSQRFIYEICFAFFDATRLCFWVYLEDTNTWLHYKLFSAISNRGSRLFHFVSEALVKFSALLEVV